MTAPPRKAAGSKGRGHPDDIDAALDEALPLDTTPEAPRSVLEQVANALGVPHAVEPDPRMGIPEGWQMIHTLMGRILADLGPVLKRERNLEQRYNFRGIDSVVNAVNAAFKTHRVYITSEIIEARFQATRTTGDKATREVTGKIRYWFNAPDGSRVPTEVLTEALDQSDKGGPKGMSVALRIALLQTFLLPTDEPTTDHEYLTRDGQNAMPPTTAALVLAAVEDPATTVARLRGELWAVVVEHSAWDRQAPADPSERTWLQAFADRYAREVSAVRTYAEGRSLRDALDAARALDWRVGEHTLDRLLGLRAEEIRVTYRETFDHVMAHILAAEGRDQLDNALGCMEAAIEALTLPASARDKLAPVAEERRPKLPEVAPQPEPDTRTGEPEPFSDEYAAAYERRRQAFALRAAQAPIAGQGEEPLIRERAVHTAVADLLTGEFSGDPAATYGSHGFTLVRDAIVAAHRRDQTIGDRVRTDLDALLAEHVAIDAENEARGLAAEEAAAQYDAADHDDDVDHDYE